ncbi:MAG: glycosyltransferase family 39 protein [Polyangiaceae bacterium]|nr:glycosyltransferase family 39 protein [Polyangiaceae bacterium]
MTRTASSKQPIGGSLARVSVATWVAVAVSILGLALRIEHAYTFDGLARGSDYVANVGGVYWMLEHWRPFDFTDEVEWSVKYQPPLWSAVAALVLKVTNSERAIAYGAVLGWAIRQFLLSRITRQMAPRHPWATVAALSVNAILPISVLTDGKVNPENYHTTLFTIATFFLWRAERQALTPSGVSYVTAGLFGLFAGLSILTKGTASVLLMVAAVVLVWQSQRILRRFGWVVARRRLAGQAATAIGVLCIVSGWWVAPNLQKYHHPFPHIWDTEGPEKEPILAQPFFYRRPLGWALPFEWKEYVRLPMNRNSSHPRPNYWATMVAGTWTDWYNRGFCRLPGGPSTTEAWGGWPVTYRCVRVYKELFWTGILLTVMALLSVAHTAHSYVESKGLRGSLVLPVVIVLGAAFPGLFALGYPYDNAAVLNPRYLLPISIPMAACLAVALAHLKKGSPGRMVAHVLAFGAIAVGGILVIYERFGA